LSGHTVSAPHPIVLCASASVPSARKRLRVGTPLFPVTTPCPHRIPVPSRIQLIAVPSPRPRRSRSAHPSPCRHALRPASSTRARQSPVHWHRRPIPHPPTPLRALLSAHLCRLASIAQLYPPPVPVLLPDSGAVKTTCPLPRGLAHAPCTVHLPLRPALPPRHTVLSCAAPSLHLSAMPSPRISTVYALPTAPTLAAARVDRTAVSPLPVAPPLALCPHR
ncbi:hypothetical protein B0H14DRAFT_2999605, partial [Mycena olivaceomarginata]